MRTLLEAAISIFAFCKNPREYSKLYLNYRAVLDWKYVCLDEEHFGCPIHHADDEEHKKDLAERKAEAKNNLMKVGEPFIRRNKKKASADRLCEALLPGHELRNYFRHTWYPESRRELLEQEEMGWIDDVIYKS